MNPIDDEDQAVTQDELTALKARADLMNISYHPSIGVEKLREKINAALNSEETAEDSVDGFAQPTEETQTQLRLRRRRESAELVRIRVTCMNPAKKEWEGEIFSAGNAVTGMFTKYVPFNADEGWHVPRIIYQQIRDRKCQIFVSERDSQNRVIRTGKLIKEFAVEVMPNLTQEELAELARRQAMSKSID